MGITPEISRIAVCLDPFLGTRTVKQFHRLRRFLGVFLCWTVVFRQGIESKLRFYIADSFSRAIKYRKNQNKH